MSKTDISYGNKLELRTEDGLITRIYINGKELTGVRKFKLEQGLNDIMCATFTMQVEKCDVGLDKIKIIKKPPFKAALKIKEFLERLHI